MDCSSGSWMTVIIVLILLPAMYASPIPPGNNTNSTTELLGNQSKDDCLANQFLDINNVCMDCTYCHPGEEHSSQEECGYGEGDSMTCKPCEDEYYQAGEGYSKLKCRRCVTCDHLSEILQECTSTQDRQCGPCPENYFKYSNWCLECSSPHDHPDCAQMNATPEPPTTSTNQSTAPSSSNSSPASLKALPTNPPSSSLPSGDNEGTTSIPEITGSVTVKGVGLGLGVGAVVFIILICIVVIIYWQYKKCAGTPSAASTTTRDSASYKSVATISKDQPSTSSAADPAIECTPGDVLPQQPLLRQEREQTVRVSQPDTRSVDFSSSEVNNEYLSTPHTLSISGGIIRSGIEMYPNLAPGGYMSPDGVPESPGSSPNSPNSPHSPQVNFSFEYDDHQNDSSPEPLAL